jgi:hypothetical protein
MEPKDLLPILFERSNAAVTLWNIEIVVVLGLIAFLASAGKMIGHWSMKLAFTVGFLVMAGNNVVALIEVMEQRQALVDFFRTLSRFLRSRTVGEAGINRLSPCGRALLQDRKSAEPGPSGRAPYGAGEFS